MTGAVLKFIHIGFGYILCINRIVAVFPVGAEQTKRLARFARSSETYVDMTRGRETKSFILLDDGMFIACAFNPLTLLKRLNEGIRPKEKPLLSTKGGQPMGRILDGDLGEVGLEITEQFDDEDITEEDSE